MLTIINIHFFVITLQNYAFRAYSLEGDKV